MSVLSGQGGSEIAGFAGDEVLVRPVGIATEMAVSLSAGNYWVWS